MSLTGRSGEPPLGPPMPMIPRLRSITRTLAERTSSLGRRVDVDPLALLGERAALTGHRRQGTTSCGGSTRLLRAEDGWLALTLSRPDDVDLVPAWLELDGPPADLWEEVEAAVERSRTAPLLERGLMLGLPIAGLPTSRRAGPPLEARGSTLPVRSTLVRPAGRCPSMAGVRVVDLSSLWAGPLCGSLLAQAGAEVIKVESLARPDGARLGPTALFDLLNAGKRSVALDFSAAEDRQALAGLIAGADVVIESSRPRALEQLGIHALSRLRTGPPVVWASITGHGRTGSRGERVAFGDDAAVAGGLVGWEPAGPVFCADAVADPTTGMVAAAAVVDALHRGGSWLLDVSMAHVAAHLAGPTLRVPAGVVASAPSARRPSGRGPRLGADTRHVLSGSGSVRG